MDGYREIIHGVGYDLTIVHYKVERIDLARYNALTYVKSKPIIPFILFVVTPQVQTVCILYSLRRMTYEHSCWSVELKGISQ